MLWMAATSKMAMKILSRSCEKKSAILAERFLVFIQLENDERLFNQGREFPKPTLSIGPI